jgi:hypothetical protein
VIAEEVTDDREEDHQPGSEDEYLENRQQGLTEGEVS